MVTLLGPDGQPFTTDTLKAPQTSRLAVLRHEFQGHPSRGLTPSRLAQILLGAEQGDPVAQYELFEDMEEKDGHVASEMGKRRRAVTGLDWNVVPPNSPYAREKAAAVQVKELIDAIPDFEGLLYDLTDAIGKGFACLEIEWHQVDGFWLPKTVTHRPQGWFRFHRGYRQALRLDDHSAEGAPLQPFGWITHIHKAKSGYLERAGLFRVLVWPYLFKNYAVADLAEFLEIYGIPLRVGKYPPGASEKEKATLLRALASIGHNAAGIIPEGMLLEFHNAASGDPKAFELMMDWCERTESKVILGGTLTSQADRGSNTNALGNVHNEVRKDLRDADAKQLATTLSRDLVYPLAVLNGLATGGQLRLPRFVLETSEPEDLSTYATALPALAGIGLRIPRQWAQEKLGIPEPEADEEVLGSPPAPAPAPLATALRAALAAQRPADDHAIITALADRLEADANAPMDEWIDALRDLVEHAGSLEEIRDGLLTRFSTLSTDSLADLMRQALVAGHLAGRAQVLDESDHA